MERVAAGEVYRAAGEVYAEQTTRVLALPAVASPALLVVAEETVIHLVALRRATASETRAECGGGGTGGDNARGDRGAGADDARPQS